MRPLALRTQLTLFYTVILAFLLTALGGTYYQVLARQLDADATAARAPSDPRTLNPHRP